jgi:hypothetical protein
MQTRAILHPLNPTMGNEIKLAVNILEANFPEVPLRYKWIDVQELLKDEVVPLIEAERLGKALPQKSARLLYALFHRLDNGSLHKSLLNSDISSVVYAK